jgi:hypothetical protein
VPSLDTFFRDSPVRGSGSLEMVARALLLATLLVMGTIAIGAPVAPTAGATHACGWNLPCPHPGDAFCLVIFKKYTPSLYQKFCPYA